MKNIIHLITAFIIITALYSFVKFAEAIFFNENAVAVISGFILMVQIYFVISIFKRSE